MNYKTDTSHGKYFFQNKEKVINGTDMAIYKSNWEKKVFWVLDNNEYVVKWGYEIVQIPYYDIFAEKWRIYLPDLLIHRKNQDGSITVMLFEIKPSTFMEKPKLPTTPKKGGTKAYMKKMARYENVLREYNINMLKFQAAEQWCADKGIIWGVINEKNTGSLFS